MSVHLLDCECGKQIAVEPRQAGSQIPCTCGNLVTAPSMREIRDLPMANQAGASDKFRSKWSLQQGLIFFFGGLTILIATLVLGFLAYAVSRLDTTEPEVSLELKAKSDEYINNAPPEELIDQFYIIEQTGLDYVPEHPYIANRVYARNLKIGMAVAGVFLIMGIAAVGYASMSK